MSSKNAGDDHGRGAGAGLEGGSGSGGFGGSKYQVQGIAGAAPQGTGAMGFGGGAAVARDNASRHPGSVQPGDQAPSTPPPPPPHGGTVLAAELKQLLDKKFPPKPGFNTTVELEQDRFNSDQHDFIISRGTSEATHALFKESAKLIDPEMTVSYLPNGKGEVWHFSKPGIMLSELPGNHGDELALDYNEDGKENKRIIYNKTTGKLIIPEKELLGSDFSTIDPQKAANLLGTDANATITSVSKTTVLTEKHYENPALKQALQDYEAAYQAKDSDGKRIRNGQILDEKNIQAIIDNYGASKNAQLAEEQIKHLREQTDLLKTDNEFNLKHPELKDDAKLSEFTKTPEWADVQARQQAISQYNNRLTDIGGKDAKVENFQYTGLPAPRMNTPSEAPSSANAGATANHNDQATKKVPVSKEQEQDLRGAIAAYNAAIPKGMEDKKISKDEADKIVAANVKYGAVGTKQEIERFRESARIMQKKDFGSNAVESAMVDAQSNHAHHLAADHTNVDTGKGIDYSTAFQKLDKIDKAASGESTVIDPGKMKQIVDKADFKDIIARMKGDNRHVTAEKAGQHFDVVDLGTLSPNAPGGMGTDGQTAGPKGP